MNIAPADASQAPYTSSGEIVDRTQGTLPVAAGGRSSSGSSGGGNNDELRKKSMAAKSKKTTMPLEEDESDDDEDEKESSAKTTADIDDADEKPAAKKRRARKKWKKPRDKPNRPLSAYNLFFQKQRAIMLGEDAEKHDGEKGKKRVHRKTHGKIGFQDMARIIGAKWKTLSNEEKSEFKEIAAKEKERYAHELAVWKEEQKKKEEVARKMAKDMKGSSNKDYSKDETMGNMGLISDQEMQLRMQMMAESHRGRFPFFSADTQQRQQMPAIEYLRAMQEDRASSMFAGGSFIGNSAQQQFPNASEASANALLHQFQSPPHVAGMDGSGGGISDYQHVQMARMQQMMNSSMMGGPMSVGMMGGAMGMGSSFPPMSDMEFQRLQHMRMLQGNQMDASNSGMSGSNESHQGGLSNMDPAMMRRFQNRFGRM